MPSLLLPLSALVPILLAPLAWALGRKRPMRAVLVMIAASAAALAALAVLLARAAGGLPAAAFALPGFCGLGLAMRADGFRALYACVAGAMWLVTSIFSLDYMRREHGVARYAFFTLVTLGAVVGLFLCDTLYSAFLFFEVMSLASYLWVAHEETPDAMRAAETYLYVAVIGGLVMLMGLFLLPEGLATASFGELPALAASAGAPALWLPAVLLLTGFGAKAGAFPLHIWLPKAHPVAPAPASALLSGLLTKAGVFGVLVLTCGLMRGAEGWGGLIFRLGVITMVLGAALAVLSVNLKRTLACSSLSQIGFILLGAGLTGVMGGENSLAAMGTVEHMLNHSLFKLTLFLCAGAVAMNAGALTLNDVRGCGRGKPALHFAFLMGALGIGGVPLWSGYCSKSLLHEALLEHIAALRAAGQNALPYEAGEWLFILSGGMTLCYMAKLYVCLFWRKDPARQREFDAQRRGYLSPLPKAMIALCGAAVMALGLWPQGALTGAARLSLGFLGAEAPALPIAYFSGENLLGAGKSALIGAGLYALCRLLLMKREADGSVRYLDRLPAWADLETMVYRPLLRALAALGGLIAAFLDRLMDWLSAGLLAAGGFAARVMDLSPDLTHFAVSRSLLKPRRGGERKPAPVGNRFTYALGTLMDRTAAAAARLAGREPPAKERFVTLLAAGGEEAGRELHRVARSISFGLLMFCAGLCLTLIYLLAW